MIRTEEEVCEFVAYLGDASTHCSITTRQKVMEIQEAIMEEVGAIEVMRIVAEQ